MNLIQMKLAGFSDEKYNSKVSDDDFTVMMNPESITWDRSVAYNEKSAINNSKPELGYYKTNPDTLSFELILDGTGVVDAANIDVADNIHRLSNIVFNYQGEIHRPNFVKIYWGKQLQFKGVLTHFNTAYTLFKSDGEPLRAKLKLTFQAFTDAKTTAKQENKQSPDMTHLVDVIASDTLPNLSQRIYNSSDYYLQLAQVNGLDKFRQLQPNQQLTFPPIVNDGVRQ